MSFQKKYSIYCITEGIVKEAWAMAPITECPTDPAHTVNPDSVNEEGGCLTENVVASTADTNFVTNLIVDNSANRNLILPASA